MATIENVSGTAFVVAELRAQEHAEAAPLYQDLVVGLFLNEGTRRAADRVATAFPQVKDLVRIRTKYLDDTLEAQLRSGVRQVAVLGAGLDTRAVRKRAEGVTYFEIDDAATLKMKEACYEAQRLDVDVAFIPGNYVTDGLIDLLAQHDFDFGLPTYVIWEGNTMYLPQQSTTEVLQQLRNCVGQFRVSFDYMAESVISKTTGDPGVTSLVESFERMGAPWLAGISDVQSLARELKLNVIENFRTSELRRMYGLGRVVTSPIFNLYSLCTLGS
jgi:methyltransferase (TIGR00027 family)